MAFDKMTLEEAKALGLLADPTPAEKARSAVELMNKLIAAEQRCQAIRAVEDIARTALEGK